MTYRPDEATAVLERTPAVLRVWLADLPEPWLRATEGPDTWCAFDVVGHLIHRQHLATWTAHDLSHLAQIARVMAKRYGEDVGPWKAYLSILR